MKKATSEEERERLLREHEENLAKFEESLKREQDRSKKALQVMADMQINSCRYTN